MDRLLQVRVPGLHLTLESDARFTSNTDADEMRAQMPRAQRGSSQIEMEWLSSMRCIEVGPGQIVDLEGEWVEKSTPEGVLFSAEGLLLKLKSTFFEVSGEVGLGNWLYLYGGSCEETMRIMGQDQACLPPSRIQVLSQL